MNSKDQTVTGVLQLANSNKSFPAISMVRSDPVMAASISKLVKPRQVDNVNTSGDRSQSNINRSELEMLSADISEKTTDYQSILQLFPDIELAAQILVSSIISPKDMTSTEIIIKNEIDIFPHDVLASLMKHVITLHDKNYKLDQEIALILREVLFEDGCYVKAVIPESSIDDLINKTSKFKTSNSGGLSFSKENLVEAKLLTREGGIAPKGLLGDPFANSSADPKRNVVLEMLNQYTFGHEYQANICERTDPTKSRVVLEGMNLKVTDNTDVFKLPSLLKKIKLNRLADTFSNPNTIAFESYGSTNNKDLTPDQVRGLIYKSKNAQTKDFEKIKTQEELFRDTVGAPLILKLPAESVIPVHVPGDTKNHVGYFCMIDEEGNPVSKQSSSSHFNDLQNRLKSGNNNLSSTLMQKASSMTGKSCTSLTFDQGSKIYSDIVERDLVERLRTGLYGSTMTVAKSQEIYRIMLARALSNQMTQLIYIPAELVTYFAYKYDHNGIGKSLLDDQRILNSLRAMMTFARVMASIKNSVGRTEVKMKLDERDPDPQKTIEQTMHEISKTRQNYFPLGINSPVDLVEWIQKSGFEFTYEGHPRIPDMNLQYSEKASNFPKPDTELDEELKKRSIQAIGLSPETVDNGLQPEFATTAVQNNILLSKRVIQIQNEITPQLSKYLQMLIKNDGSAIIKIKEIINNNLSKIKSNFTSSESDASENSINMDAEDSQLINYLTVAFINAIEVKLPQPNSVTLENQMQAFDLYSDALDKSIKAWISTELINSNMAGEISNNVDNIVAIIKAHYQRKWLADNNVLPELSELTAMNEDNKAMVDFVEIQKSHMSGLMKSSVLMLSKMKPIATAGDKDITKINDGQGLDQAETGSTSDTSSDTTTDDTTDTGDTTDDLGGDGLDDLNL